MHFNVKKWFWLLLLQLKVDMPILTCIFFTFNWLTLTSEMDFVKFHPEVASCLLSRGKRKYAPLGMRLIWKYIRNYFLVYQLISHFLPYLQNYKEFKAKIMDLQPEKYGLSFDIKKCTSSGWTLGDENVIGIRAFKWVGHPKSKWSIIILGTISKLVSASQSKNCQETQKWYQNFNRPRILSVIDQNMQNIVLINDSITYIFVWSTLPP